MYYYTPYIGKNETEPRTNHARFMSRWKRYDYTEERKPEELNEPEYDDCFIGIFKLYSKWISTATEFNHTEYRNWVINMGINITPLQTELLIETIRGGIRGSSKLERHITQ